MNKQRIAVRLKSGEKHLYRVEEIMDHEELRLATLEEVEGAVACVVEVKRIESELKEAA